MDTVDGGGAELRIQVLFAMDVSLLQQTFVETLCISGGQLAQSDISDTRDGIAFNDQMVAVDGCSPYIWLGVEFITKSQSLGDCVISIAHIQVLAFLNSLSKLFFYLRLCLTQNILDNPFADAWEINYGIYRFSQDFFFLLNIAFTVCSFFDMAFDSFSNTNTYLRREEMSTAIFYWWIVFQGVET